jgi:hypothetical protein
LDLSGQEIGDQGIKHLSTALKNNKVILLAFLPF